MPSSFVLPQRMLSFPLLECCAGKRKFVYFCELWSKISVNINVLSCTYRLYLAAMHYNENGDRPQAETEEGVPLFKISFPKSRKGECRVKPQKTQQTFGKGSNHTTQILDFLKLIYLDKESNKYKHSKKNPTNKK